MFYNFDSVLIAERSNLLCHLNLYEFSSFTVLDKNILAPFDIKVSDLILSMVCDKDLKNVCPL